MVTPLPKAASYEQRAVVTPLRKAASYEQRAVVTPLRKAASYEQCYRYCYEIYNPIMLAY